MPEKSRPRTPRKTSRPPAANQFRREAKIDEGTLIRIAFGFCTGAPLQSIAERAGVSVKTVRAIVLRLRGRLAQPKFNRWHAAYQKLPAAKSSGQEFLAHEGFIDALSGCYANATCFRNFTLGNRRGRLCRSCPLPGSFSTNERLREALDVVDRVRAFYERLGIRGGSGTEGSTTFYLRLIHTTTISTALAASATPDGRRLRKPLDVERAHFLSVWTLLDLLMLDLAERPI